MQDPPSRTPQFPLLRNIFLFLTVVWVASLTQPPSRLEAEVLRGALGDLLLPPPLPSMFQEVEKSGQLNVTKIAQGGRKLR